MKNKKKHFTEFQLRDLLNETKTREPTEEELDILREMLWEKYGTASYGMYISPHWLLNDPFDDLDITYPLEEEKEEVKEWRERATLDEFDKPEYEKTNPPITIICEKPLECRSRQRFGNACKCIRENFRNEDDFIEWRKIKMSELKENILKIIE